MNAISKGIGHCWFQERISIFLNPGINVEQEGWIGGLWTEVPYGPYGESGAEGAEGGDW